MTHLFKDLYNRRLFDVLVHRIVRHFIQSTGWESVRLIVLVGAGAKRRSQKGNNSVPTREKIGPSNVTFTATNSENTKQLNNLWT